MAAALLRNMSGCIEKDDRTSINNNGGIIVINSTLSLKVFPPSVAAINPGAEPDR